MSAGRPDPALSAPSALLELAQIQNRLPRLPKNDYQQLHRRIVHQHYRLAVGPQLKKSLTVSH